MDNQHLQINDEVMGRLDLIWNNSKHIKNVLNQYWRYGKMY